MKLRPAVSLQHLGEDGIENPTTIKGALKHCYPLFLALKSVSRLLRHFGYVMPSVTSVTIKTTVGRFFSQTAHASASVKKEQRRCRRLKGLSVS